MILLGVVIGNQRLDVVVVVVVLLGVVVVVVVDGGVQRVVGDVLLVVGWVVMIGRRVVDAGGLCV